MRHPTRCHRLCQPRSPHLRLSSSQLTNPAADAAPSAPAPPAAQHRQLLPQLPAQLPRLPPLRRGGQRRRLQEPRHHVRPQRRQGERSRPVRALITFAAAVRRAPGARFQGRGRASQRLFGGPLSFFNPLKPPKPHHATPNTQSACDTAQKYCNGGRPPGQGRMGAGIGTVNLAQCANIAMGACQSVSGGCWLPLGGGTGGGGTAAVAAGLSCSRRSGLNATATTEH